MFRQSVIGYSWLKTWNQQQYSIHYESIPYTYSYSGVWGTYSYSGVWGTNNDLTLTCVKLVKTCKYMYPFAMVGVVFSLADDYIRKRKTRINRRTVNKKWTPCVAPSLEPLWFMSLVVQNVYIIMFRYVQIHVST